MKQGKKLGSKWTLAKNTITINKNMKACVYIKYTQNGKTVIKKTSGFVFDKTAPKVSVTKKGKLKVTDSVSGIKKITVDGKKSKQRYKTFRRKA